MKADGEISAYKVALCSTGFAADAYDLFIVNLVEAFLTEEFPKHSSLDIMLLSSSMLWASLVGQLTFGILADRFGRKALYVTTVALIAAGSLLSSLYFPGMGIGPFVWVPLFRAVMGIGIGGEYPLSASVASESVGPKTAGKLLAIVFSFQGVGGLLSCSVFALCMAFGASPAFTWRFALAFGAVPTLVAVAMRSRMEENDEFTDAHKQEEALSVGHWKATRAMLSTYRNVLIGTAGCWFLLDVSFYANGLFSSEITAAVQLGDSLDAKVKNSLLVALISLPGYYFSVAFLDKVGRWRLQFFGFVILAALFFFLAAMLPRLRKMPFVLLLLYGATFFFSNFGPNATTYIIPGEIYPSAVKATCHGISAAAGKLGASLAAVFFAPVAEAGDARSIMAVCGVAALFGSLWTLLFIPDYTPESLPAFVKEHTEKFHSRLGVVGGGAGRAVGRPVEYQVLPVRPKRPEGGPESEMQTEGRRASPGYGIPRSPKPEARGDTEMTIFGQTTDS